MNMTVLEELMIAKSADRIRRCATHEGSARLVGCLIALYALTGTVPAAAQQFEPLGNGDGVCFIGNSFTSFFGPLPRAIQAVYKAADPFCPVLLKHTNEGKSCGILKEYVVLDSVSARVSRAIEEGGWTYVVLQTYLDAIDQYDVVPDESAPCSGAPRDGYPHNQDTLIKYYSILDSTIKAVGARTMLYAPHFPFLSYRDSGREKAIECFERLQQQADVPFFVPVFWAWDSIMADYPPTNWGAPIQGGDGIIGMLYNDFQHQNIDGMALDAFTWYTVLTGGASPVGLRPMLATNDTARNIPDTSLMDYTAGVGYVAGRRILTAMGYGDDLDRPSQPRGLSVSGKADSSILLSWSSANDNVGVTSYEVLVDGVPYDTTTQTSMTIEGVDMAGDHNLNVRARDAAGHRSISSLPISTGNSLRYEAENHWWSCWVEDAAFNTAGSFSGNGYVRVRRPGAWQRFLVHCPGTGQRTATLTYFPYQWQSGYVGHISVRVNGDSVGQFGVTWTEGERGWKEADHYLSLDPGYNTIEYRLLDPPPNGSLFGEIWMDFLTLENDGVVGLREVGLRQTATPTFGTVTITPHPLAGHAELLVTSTASQHALVTVSDISGRRLHSVSARLTEGTTAVRLDTDRLWNRVCIARIATASGSATLTFAVAR